VSKKSGVTPGFLTAIAPFIYSKYINALVASLSFSSSYSYAIIYGIIVMANIFLGYFELKFCRILNQKIEFTSISSKLKNLYTHFHHDENLDPKEIDRARKDIKQVSSFASNSFLVFPIQIIRICVSFLIVFSFSKKLAIFVILLPLLLKFIFEKYKDILNELDRRLKETDSVLQAELLRYVSNLNLIVRHMAEPIANDTIKKSFQDYEKANLNSTTKNYIFSASNQLIFFCFNIMTMIVCGYLFENKVIQIGHIGLTLAYFGQFNDLFNQIVQFGREYNESQVSYQRSLNFFEAQNSNLKGNKISFYRTYLPSKNELNVEIQELFRRGNLILRDFKCKFEGAKIYRIEGENGSGKSSFLKAICQETVNVRGVLTHEGTRPDPIKYHSQETQFYFDTVKENIQLFKIDSDLLKFKKNFLALFGSGLSETEFLNKEISTLSGGQKQRLQLLLSFSSSFNVICLDEPFTGLDSASIEQLKKLIEDERQSGKIIILVAHDQNFDGMAVESITLSY
jgi:Cu-processing system ATP-binding protein